MVSIVQNIFQSYRFYYHLNYILTAWNRLRSASFKATPSDLGLSPSHTTKDSGRLCSPSSRTLGKGPSGAPAATLFSVKRSFSQSCLSFSRSS